MSIANHISHLRNEEIDKKKWDDCITSSQNGLIYAYSFYLDHMARNWDALVLGDYEAVMPVTWNKKFGIHYLYQPFLAAQLGVFGKNLSSKIIEEFLSAIPSKFRYWDIYLNSSNFQQKYKHNLRRNFELSLEKNYQELKDGYNQNLNRNIRKAENAGCIFREDVDGEEVIKLALSQMQMREKSAAENVERFRELFKHLHAKGMAKAYGVLSKDCDLLSSCIFFFSNNRAYYVLVGNDNKGRTEGSSHLLIDGFIRSQSGKNITLDFEGSDIPGLAKFYASFGAMEVKYFAIRLNRLPWYLRWMKS